jgi:outer membrane protein assembly factor BamB
VLALAGAARADDWPQWLGPRRDGVWRETGILTKFPSGGPKVLWRAALGPGYTGPAVQGGRVFVMDRQGAQPEKGAEGSGKNGLPGRERVLCLDAKTGAAVWEHGYDCTYKISYASGPRCTPTVHQGKVYALGTMGDLHCLDAATGQLVWAKNFVREYRCRPPVWGWASHPLVDGDKVITLVGGAGSAVVAFHKDTGKELWRSLTIREVGYAPVVIVEAGGKRQLIAWHTEAVNSLDPETGNLYWSEKFPAEVAPVRPGITVPTPLQIGDRLYFTCCHHGSLLLELAKDRPAARVVWKGKSHNISKADTLNSLISTPAVKDGYVYGVCVFGELRCLDLQTGRRLWQTYADTCGKKTLFATAFLNRQGDQFFIFNDRGDLMIARLTPKGYEEVDRAHLLEPTLFARGRDVVWSQPAYANRCLFVRNDKEIICVALAADGS